MDKYYYYYCYYYYYYYYYYHLGTLWMFTRHQRQEELQTTINQENVLKTRSEPISEVWGSQPVNRHYFQNISLVEKRWKLFSRQRGSSLLCVSLLLRQRKVILCCCETTFLIIAELTYSLTYQIIISPMPSFTPISLKKILWTSVT